MYVAFFTVSICRWPKSWIERTRQENLPLLYLDRCHAKALECYSQSVRKYVSGARSPPLLHSLSIEGCLISYFIPVLAWRSLLMITAVNLTLKCCSQLSCPKSDFVESWTEFWTIKGISSERAIFFFLFKAYFAKKKYGKTLPKMAFFLNIKRNICGLA